MNKISRFFLCAVAAVLSMFASSCVHEWPEISGTTDVELTIKHYLPWTTFDYEIDGSRGADETRSVNPWYAHYDVHVYRAGNTTDCIKRVSFDSYDLTFADFTTSINLPEGEWDIYIWQDLRCEGEEPFYNADNFGDISWIKPYRGLNDHRDAFEGKVTVNVPATYSVGTSIKAEMTMERPFTKYVFIATDFEKFVAETLTKAGLIEDTRAWAEMTPVQREQVLKGYKIIVLYPYFLPSVYNMFTSKVIDSDRSISFEADITPLNDNEAMVAFDYVFINHRESGVQVQLGLKTPEGQTVQLTKILTIPLLRNRITYVRGPFLTTQSGSGINIDVSFSGEFNIQI